MQRERTSTIGQGKGPRVTKSNEMTRFEIIQCGCGHEWVRPRGRPNTMPCGQCGNAHLKLRTLHAGPPTTIDATIR